MSRLHERPTQENLPRRAPVRTVIMGAAGRDFHNFNVAYRDDPLTRVVAFTAAQIPGIAGRRYPAALCGPHYPEGIPIVEEAQLAALCRAERVQRVVFAYSDVGHATVMHAASRVLAAGANFVLLGPQSTQLRASKPVVAVSAVRTGCGKSQTSRWLGRALRARGRRVAVLRHPMPYGDLLAERVQRFASTADIDAAGCTAEEREEYEPHVAAGNVVYAGVDYGAILAEAQREADVIVWDGGNNDFPFLKTDLHIVVADALRPGQAEMYHPGEAVLRMADVVVVNKVDAATPAQLEAVLDEVKRLAPGVPVVRARSPVKLDDPDAVRGRKALVIEDGPTITHGGMAFGAGFVAARDGGASAVLDPRRSAPPALRVVYAQYPHIGPVLPAVGYTEAQLHALRETIAGSEAEVVVSATPFDLAAQIKIDKPVVRARYEYADADAGDASLASHLDAFLARHPR
jgi:predicted GTPase